MSRAVRQRALLGSLLLLIPLSVLTACGSSSGPGSGSGSGSDEAGGKPPKGFPYTVTNCGVKTTYEKPPERAVTMNQNVTEIMLALGLQDRMAGTAYLDDKIAPEYRKAYGKVKVLAEKYPSKETLLGANPDFVYGAYTSAFEKGEGRERAGLRDSGVDTRLAIESCAKDKVGVPQLRQEIREVARTFGVPERAEKLIRKQDARLAATAKRLKGAEKKRVFVYDSGDNMAFTAGGKGIGNEIIERAGAENVFSSVDRPFGEVSWEKVVEQKPDVIVIYDYGGTPLAKKKQRLLDDPALKDVPAIEHKRFAVLPLSSTVVGPRVPDAVDELARQLHPDRYK